MRQNGRDQRRTFQPRRQKRDALAKAITPTRPVLLQISARQQIVQKMKQAGARDVQIGQQAGEGGRFCRIRHILKNVECAVG